MIVRSHTYRSTRRQEGVVLIVGLLMLLAMTLIGVTAMKSTTLDERIAANTQFKAEAFQASESMLSDALDYDAVSRCAFDTAGCQCQEKEGEELSNEKRSLCIARGWLRICGTDGENSANCPDRTQRVPAKSAMAYEKEMPVYGNSIGSGSFVAGKVVEIKSTVDWTETNATATHNLAVGVVGLKSAP